MIIPSKMIAKDLETQGFGTLATDLFINRVPSEPNNVVVVLDGPHMNPDNNNYVYYEPTVEVLLRGTAYETLYKKAMNILEYLNKKTNYTYTDDEAIEWHIVCLLHLNGPFPLGVDDDERSLISVNFRLQIEPNN